MHSRFLAKLYLIPFLLSATTIITPILAAPAKLTAVALQEWKDHQDCAMLHPQLRGLLAEAEECYSNCQLLDHLIFDIVHRMTELHCRAKIYPVVRVQPARRPNFETIPARPKQVSSEELTERVQPVELDSV